MYIFLFFKQACFDVREYSNLYRLLDLVKYDPNLKTPSYLKIHPTFEDRVRKTDETIDKVRKTCFDVWMVAMGSKLTLDQNFIKVVKVYKFYFIFSIFFRKWKQLSNYFLRKY